MLTLLLHCWVCQPRWRAGHSASCLCECGVARKALILSLYAKRGIGVQFSSKRLATERAFRCLSMQRHLFYVRRAATKIIPACGKSDRIHLEYTETDSFTLQMHCMGRGAPPYTPRCRHSKAKYTKPAPPPHTLRIGTPTKHAKARKPAMNITKKLHTGKPSGFRNTTMRQSRKFLSPHRRCPA